MSTIDDVERTVAPILESSGLELVDVEMQARVVRVTVDRDGGVDLDAIGSATSAISRALDAADVVPGGRYELEVSSPGLERRLRRPEHFRRQLGVTVSVKTKPGVPGERRLEGRLAAADEHSIRLEGQGVEGGSRELSYGDIEKATTVFDWRAALAGRGRTEASPAGAETDQDDTDDDHTDESETR